MYWTSTYGRIELEMTLAQAQSACHPGPCDDDVKALVAHPKIARQLRKLDPVDVARELRDFGAWSMAELSDHRANLLRLVWIAACDIAEEHAQGHRS